MHGYFGTNINQYTTMQTASLFGLHLMINKVDVLIICIMVQLIQKINRFHPTQKPVALYKWLLKNYAKQGDKILDTHVGSASSFIAAYDMGFDILGFEIDTDYYRMATERIGKGGIKHK